MAVSCSETLEANLPYELSEIPEPLKCRARTELFEDEDTRIHSLKLLRSMLKDEPNLRWQDDDLFLLSFLRARKFDVQRAFHLTKNLYTQMDKYDELFSNFNFQDVKRTLEENVIGFLPYRDSEGSVILVIRASHWNPSGHSFGDILRALTCALLHASLSPATQIAGFKVIFDFAGLSLRHVPHITPSYVFFLAEGLQIHFCGKNIKKIHKFISPSLLPADYQGELPPYDNTEWRQLVEEKADYIDHVFSHGYTKPRSKSQEKK